MRVESDLRGGGKRLFFEVPSRFSARMLGIYAILQFLSIFMHICRRQILGNAQEMEVAAVVGDHAGLFSDT
jgi:hypothetical protein